MYKLTFNDNRFVLQDEINYVRKHENGSFVPCTQIEAEGVAYNGKVYALHDTGLLTGPNISISKIDDCEAVGQSKSIADIVFVQLANEGKFDDSTVGEHADLFVSWQTGVAYKIGEIVRDSTSHDLYTCLQAHTSQDDWNPSAAPSLWKHIDYQQDGLMIWAQPLCASDAYSEGDVVCYNDKKYQSEIDGNVWSPDTTGWKELVDNTNV